ncbi:MAG: GTP 3',8-cyclase MoaA [Acidobacteriota bacterium]
MRSASRSSWADAPEQVSLPRAGLLDDGLGRPLRDLRISVTDRCSFRCGYCMPEEKFGPRFRFLERRELLTYEELIRLSRLFMRLGVRKIRITGGEPLLRRDLPRLVALLAALPDLEDLALTTNGVLLPSLAGPLRAAGLKRVTVSLDTLDGKLLKAMNGRRADVDQVLAGIDAAVSAGFRPVKINAVILRGVNEASILELARHFHGSGQILRFIEFMDVGHSNGWRPGKVVPESEILQRIHAVFPLEALPPSHPGEVARRYRSRDGGGEIGVVASVSRPFCGWCNRARLSPEGRLLTCLFAAGGRDLRALLRGGSTDGEILSVLRQIWRGRDDRYSETRSPSTAARSRMEMHHIGG